MTSVTIEDDGMIEINGVAIDVAIAAEHFSQAHKQANGEELAYHDSLRDAIIRIGLQPMSHAGNHRIALIVWEKNKELQKKDAAMLAQGVEPASPTTTASTLSN